MIKIFESIGLAVAVIFGMATGFASAPKVGPPRVAMMQAPGTVTDLTATQVTDTTATLTWTGVSSGVATPASYDVRWAQAAGFQWWLARVTPPLEVVGKQAVGGEKLTVTVTGVRPQTAYLAQLVAYTGTLNVNAAFGQLSNLAPFTTTATSPNPPPPPPPPATVASVTLPGSSVAITAVGGSYQATAIVRDSTGAVLGNAVFWRSTTPSIATVDATGLIRAVGVGTDTVVATSGGKSASMLVFVSPPPPPPGLSTCAVVPPPVGCGMRGTYWALLGITQVNGTKGPWFWLDSLGRPTQVIRVVVKDTTF